MRKDYDFSNSKPNPYAGRLKQQITIRLESETIAYFKALAHKTGMSYQHLINLYLRDCVTRQRKLTFKWAD